MVNKPLKLITLSESDKDMLEDYLTQVFNNDNESLLSHYTGAVRTHEINLYNGEDRVYQRIVIDELWNEIIRRMK